jgi:hypothetical protein
MQQAEMVRITVLVVFLLLPGLILSRRKRRR